MSTKPASAIEQYTLLLKAKLLMNFPSAFTKDQGLVVLARTPTLVYLLTENGIVLVDFSKYSKISVSEDIYTNSERIEQLRNIANMINPDKTLHVVNSDNSAKQFIGVYQRDKLVPMIKLFKEAEKATAPKPDKQSDEDLGLFGADPESKAKLNEVLTRKISDVMNSKKPKSDPLGAVPEKPSEDTAEISRLKDEIVALKQAIVDYETSKEDQTQALADMKKQMNQAKNDCELLSSRIGHMNAQWIRFFVSCNAHVFPGGDVKIETKTENGVTTSEAVDIEFNGKSYIDHFEELDKVLDHAEDVRAYMEKQEQYVEELTYLNSESVATMMIYSDSVDMTKPDDMLKMMMVFKESRISTLREVEKQKDVITGLKEEISETTEEYESQIAKLKEQTQEVVDELAEYEQKFGSGESSQNYHRLVEESVKNMADNVNEMKSMKKLLETTNETSANLVELVTSLQGVLVGDNTAKDLESILNNPVNKSKMDSTYAKMVAAGAVYHLRKKELPPRTIVYKIRDMVLQGMQVQDIAAHFLS